MAETSPDFPRPPNGHGRLPNVRIELRHGNGRSLLYEVSGTGFLIGTVPGCDLRLPGADLPPVLCLLSQNEEGVCLRKLAPAFPIEINGEPLSTSFLKNEDRITLGPVNLLIHCAPVIQTPHGKNEAGENFSFNNAAELQRQLEERERLLNAQIKELETDRVIWYQRREEMEQEGRRLQELQQQNQSIRKELKGLRQEAYQKYRAKGDRLAALQEAVNRAAAKVQERKRQLDLEVQQAADGRRADAEFHQELARQAAELEDRRRNHEAEHAARIEKNAQIQQGLENQRLLLERQHLELERQYQSKLAECEDHGRRVQEDRAALDQQQAQYQADLIRLDRLASALDDRQRQLQERALEVDERWEKLKQECQELEEQAKQVEEWRRRLQTQTEQIELGNVELEAARADLARRSLILENQETQLASVRSYWERRAEEVLHEERFLVEQRSRQEDFEAELLRKSQELERRHEALVETHRTREEDNGRFEELRAGVETALAFFGQIQQNLAERDAQIHLSAATQMAEAEELQIRTRQSLELQDRLNSERHNLREREAALAQAEIGRETLQEQLRRRSEELAERQRLLAAKEQQQAAALVAMDNLQADLDRKQQEAESRLMALVEDQQRQLAEIVHKEDALGHREEILNRHQARIQAIGRAIARTKKSLHVRRALLANEQQETADAILHARQEYQQMFADAIALQQQIPRWETQAQAAADHLVRTRDQLRGHLAELHTYARQAQEDLDQLRGQVQAEGEKLRHQGQDLQRARDEHRLAVAAFRQQLIDWQGQVAELKRSLSQDESRLEQQQAEVAATSARLAKQAEKLQVQEREVSERRDEMERHLTDMREWYRRKLRELSARFGDGPDRQRPEKSAGNRELQPVAEGDPAEPAGILAITGEIEPGDRQLGDLLRSLELVDTDTLSALLVAARKQRQSLRQVLLASGYVTLYQMALIEAGNLDGLILGPVRVMDRLRASSHEAVFRVLDPRRTSELGANGEKYAMLRQLAEAEMADAVHPDEFRQRFAAVAGLQHPHLAATFEIMEINQRPAVLQEWVAGLAAPDWPPLFSVLGVWYRLLTQAAHGIHYAHQAGFVHGHLHPRLLILSTDGILKISGLGEPLWLADPETIPENCKNLQPEVEPGDDLLALGRIAMDWAMVPTARQKGSKRKPLPETVQKVLHRLNGETPKLRYPDSAALREDLDRVGAEVPPNPEAWERLVRHVRENTREDQGLRQSA